VLDMPTNVIEIESCERKNCQSTIHVEKGLVYGEDTRKTMVLVH